MALSVPAGDIMKMSVRDRFSLVKVTGDVGLEVEAEFEGPPPVLNTKFWTTKPDGSLRNGMEYVFNSPVKMKDIPTALDELKKTLSNARARMSVRTSVHMHMNVSNFSLEELSRAMTTYFLYENLLVSSQNHTRQGNLFCLRARDAEETVDAARELIVNDFRWPSGFGRDYRYSACNLQALARFGSLEFRFLGGTTNTEFMDYWSKVFYNLLHNSAEVPMSKQEELVTAGEADRLAAYFRELVSSKLSEPLITKDFASLVEDGLPYAMRLIRAYNKRVKQETKDTFFRPKIHRRHEDLPVGDEYGYFSKKKKNPTGFNRPLIEPAPAQEAQIDPLARGERGRPFANAGVAAAVDGRMGMLRAEQALISREVVHLITQRDRHILEGNINLARAADQEAERLTARRIIVEAEIARRVAAQNAQQVPHPGHDWPDVALNLNAGAINRDNREGLQEAAPLGEPIEDPDLPDFDVFDLEEENPI